MGKFNTYYFTFSKDGTQPYIGGWVKVYAVSKLRACEAFRREYPDKMKGLLNCAGIYDEHFFENSIMFKNGNFGAFCHDVIYA